MTEKCNKRKRVRFGLFLLILIGVGVVAVLLVKPKQYDGNTIDELVFMLCTTRDYGSEADVHDRLTQIGEPAVSHLIEALEEPSKLRVSWRDLYQKLWLKLPPGLKRQLPNPLMWRFQDKRPIFRVLVSIGEPPDEILAAIRTGATNSDSEMRFFAVHSLRSWPPTNANLAFPILTNALNDSAGNVRGAAVAVLGNFGAESAELVPQLVERLQDEDSHCRVLAAGALKRIGTASPDVIQALLFASNDTNGVYRAFVASTLYHLTGKPEPSIGLLEEILHAEDDDACRTALDVVASIGTNAMNLLPAVNKSTRHSEMSVRVAAVYAEWRISGNASSNVTVLSEAMLSGQRSCQLQTARLICKMGPEAGETVPALISAVSTMRDWLVRQYSIEALQSMGTNATDALPALTNQLDHSVARVRNAAVAAIAVISKSDKNGDPISAAGVSEQY